MTFFPVHSSSIRALIHPFSRSFIRGDPQVRAATWNAPCHEFWRWEYAKITQSSASGGGLGISWVVPPTAAAGHFKYITREASCLPLD